MAVGEPQRTGKLTDAEREVFRAHWREIAEAVGVQDIEPRGGAGYRGARCPKHGGDSFGVSDDGGWICRGECDQAGPDPISLVEWARVCDFTEAVEECRRIVATTTTRPTTTKAKKPKRDKLAFATDDLRSNYSEPGLIFVERWVYHDRDGRPWMIVNRMLRPDGGKTFRPQYFDGKTWVTGAPDCRLFYRLPELDKDPTKDVLIVEGEKSADAAARLFPGMVCTTWLGGAGAAGKTDWSPVKDRKVIVLGDHDKAGAKATVDAARMATAAGAADVRIVTVPEAEAAKLPEGWDVADLDKPPTDPMYAAGVDARDVVRWIADAKPFEDSEATEDEELADFDLRDDGLWARIKQDQWERIAAPVRLAKVAANENGADSTAIVEVRDRQGVSRTLPIPHADLAADLNDVWRRLAAAGFWCSEKKAHRDRLAAYLNRQDDNVPRALAVSKVGWHFAGGRWSFLFPTVAIADGTEDQDVVLTAHDSVGAFYVAGSLDDWQREIADPIAGNSRLMFVVCLAFVGPLLEPCKMSGGGVHLGGPSSCGKTTALEVAGSVWGGGGPDGRFRRQWHATANALENVAEGHNDAFLALDEISECDTRSLGAAVYMMTNGSGKARQRQDSTAQRTRSWRLVFLSTGEMSPADSIRAATDTVQRGGQAVRLVMLPAVANDELGIFDRLPGEHQTRQAAGEFADRLKHAAATYYGTASRAFVVALSKRRNELAGVARRYCDAFVSRYVPAEASAEVRRIGASFGCAYAAGMIAAELNILPWSPGSIDHAVGACFDAAVRERGNVTRSTDVQQGIGALRRWFQQEAELHLQRAETSTLRERHGYWHGADKDEARLFPASFKEVVGPAWADVAHEMTRCGWLDRETDRDGNLTRHLTKQCRIPGGGRDRFFVVKPTFYNPDTDDDAGDE